MNDALYTIIRRSRSTCYVFAAFNPRSHISYLIAAQCPPPAQRIARVGPLLGDQRIRIVEVTEYASLRDVARRHVKQITDLLAGMLRRRG